MTTPTPTPAPDPAPVTPTPVVPAPPTPPEQPLPGGGIDLKSPTWWTWALTTALSIAVTVATLIGHPFDSATANAAIPTVAILVAGIMTSLQIHGAHVVKVAEINAQVAREHEATAYAIWYNSQEGRHAA